MPHWLLATLIAFVAVMPWTFWRFSLRTLHIAINFVPGDISTRERFGCRVTDRNFNLPGP